MSANRVRRSRIAQGFLWASIGLMIFSLLSLVPPGAVGGRLAPLSAAPPAGVGESPQVLPSSLPVAVPPQVLASVRVGMEPVAAVLDPANGYVYVANLNSENISVINGTSLLGTVSLTPNETGGPCSLVYDPVNGFVYVVDQFYFESSAGAVSVINGTQVIATIAVGERPDSATVDSSNGNVYVTDFASDAVTVVQGTAALATVSVGSQPDAAAFDSGNGYVYVANRGSANVSVLSGSAVLASVNVGVGPDSVAFDPSLADVYVANNGSNNVSVLSGTGLVATDSVGTNPAFVAVDPRDAWAYVANANSSNLSVLQGSSLLATIPVGLDPESVAFGPAGGFTYVVDAQSNAVSVLNGSSPVGTVGVGSVPTTGTYDPANGYLYVTNSGSNNVSVVAPAFPVQFTETGLAPGVNWSVSLGAKTNYSTTPTIGFETLPGTLAYSIVPPAGYQLVSATPGSPLTVAAPGVQVNVTFAPISSGTYGLVFVESGLPLECAHSGWSPWSGPSWNARGEDGEWHHHGGCWGPWQSPIACGAPRGLGPELAASPSDRCLCGGGGHGGGRGNWTMSTLVWSVTVDNVTKSSNTSTISFVEPNGTYAYTIAGPRGYTVSSSVPPSPVTIAGENLTVNVTFVRTPCQRAPSVTVTFEEQGLPPATNWCVTFNGTDCSTQREIVFAGIPNGSYSFSVANVTGFTANPSSGSVTVANQSVVVTIQFTSIHHHCGGQAPGPGLELVRHRRA